VSHQTPPDAKDDSFNRIDGALNASPIHNKYLELCVNTGKTKRSLAGIDASNVAGDGAFFGKIKNRYLEIRGNRVQKFFLLKPLAVKVRQGRKIYPLKPALNLC
jgi:hypothetical protein